MQKQVQALSVKKDGVTVHYTQEYEVTEQSGEATILKATGQKTGDWRPHADLKKHLDNLRVHFLLMCNQSDVAQLEMVREDLIDKFVVSGYKIGGGEEEGEESQRGVTLVGYRKLKNGKVLNMVAPFTKFAESITDYPHAAQLSVVISHLEYEALEYLKGKRGDLEPGDQTEMAFDNSEVDQFNN